MRPLLLVLLLATSQSSFASEVKSSSIWTSFCGTAAPMATMTSFHREQPFEDERLAHPHPDDLHTLPGVEEIEDELREDLNTRILLDPAVPFPRHHGRAPEDFFDPRPSLFVRSLPIRGPPTPSWI